MRNEKENDKHISREPAPPQAGRDTPYARREPFSTADRRVNGMSDQRAVGPMTWTHWASYLKNVAS